MHEITAFLLYNASKNTLFASSLLTSSPPRYILELLWGFSQGRRWNRLPCLLVGNPRRAYILPSSQGELEGAKSASNGIKCRTKPCAARRAWSEATIFAPLRGTKIAALLQSVKKPEAFRQTEETARLSRLFFLLFLLFTGSVRCPTPRICRCSARPDPWDLWRGASGWRYPFRSPARTPRRR